ncbi:MAG: hypothetical protein V4858_00920 [Pseudomonadota bacterium]
MTTTCLHPAPSAASPLSLVNQVWKNLAAFAARLVIQAKEHKLSWQQTQALSTMDAHLLRDVGAPDWLHERAQAHDVLDCYEHMKAMAHLKY